LSKVMVVEQRARGRLAALLQTEGFEVETVGAFDRIELMLQTYAPELVVLEVTVLGVETVGTCAAITTVTSAPLVLLCETADESSILAAYRAGAASVLTESTGSRELVARARALLRRGMAVDVGLGDVITVGPVVLDRACRQLTVGGRLVPVPRREFDIAEALMRRAGTVVTRRNLLMELWGGTTRDSKTLDVQVGRLRARLAAAEGRRRILTVRGVGYRFVTDDDLARGILVGSDADGA